MSYKPMLRYWWRSSLAGEFWYDLTPLGRLVIWPPVTLLAYAYLLCLFPFAVIEKTYSFIARHCRRSNKVQQLFWRPLK